MLLALPVAVNVFILTEKFPFILNNVGIKKMHGMDEMDRKQVDYPQTYFQEWEEILWMS